MDLDAEVGACFSESRVSSLRYDPGMSSQHLFMQHTVSYSHLWLYNAPLRIRLLSRAEACHQYRLCTSSCSDTRRPCWGIEHCKNHSYDLSFHLSNPWENIRMYWIGDTELLESFRLKLDQAVSPMVDSSTNKTIFPPRMLHFVHFLQFCSDLCFRPPLLWQCKVATHARSLRNQFAFHLCDCFVDLCLYLAPYTGKL